MTTDAGRRLLSALRGYSMALGSERVPTDPVAAAQFVAAIEAEARAATLAEVRAKVEARIHIRPTASGQVYDAALKWVLALLDAPAPTEPERDAERLAANDELLYVRGERDGKTVPVLYKRIPAPSEPGRRCDDDFYCGECPDCLSGEHPENRLRGEQR